MQGTGESSSAWGCCGTELPLNGAEICTHIPSASRTFSQDLVKCQSPQFPHAGGDIHIRTLWPWTKRCCSFFPTPHHHHPTHSHPKKAR